MCACVFVSVFVCVNLLTTHRPLSTTLHQAIKIVMPDSECGPWIHRDVLFGEPTASAKAQADANGLARNEEAALRRIRVRFAWEAWGDCWKLLNKPLDYPDGVPEQEVRNARADEVQALTAYFVKKHVAAVGTTEGLYLHILHAHVHQQVRKWGDLRVRQSQGLEHCHKFRKQIGLNGTNRKKGQRLETMLAFKMVLAELERSMADSLQAVLHTKKTASAVKRMHAKIERGAAEMKALGPITGPLTD